MFFSPQRRPENHEAIAGLAAACRAARGFSLNPHVVPHHGAWYHGDSPGRSERVLMLGLEAIMCGLRDPIRALLAAGDPALTFFVRRDLLLEEAGRSPRCGSCPSRSDS